MGKRKAKSKPPPKKAKAVLPSTFTCLFCNHENAVSVKMDKKAQTGDLWCKICGQSFQTTINALSDPVDVYSDWVDACDSVAKEAARGNHSPFDNDNAAGRENQITRDITSGYDDGEIDPEGDFEEDDE